MEDSPFVIRVQYAPDGSVAHITDVPGHASGQAWFDHLTRQAGDAYRAVGTGRAAFDLTAAQVALLKVPFEADGTLPT